MAAGAGDLLAFRKGPAADGAVDGHLGKHRALASLAVAGPTVVAVADYAVMVGDESRIAHRMHTVRSAQGNRQAAGSMAGGAFGDFGLLLWEFLLWKGYCIEHRVSTQKVFRV